MPPDFIETTANGLRCAYKAGRSPNAPLIVSLHGKAGTLFVTQPFFATFPAETCIVCFEAPLADSLGGFSWWDYDPSKEKSDAQWTKAEPAAEQLQKAVLEFESSTKLSPVARIGVGFSQGGGLLSVALQKQPTFFNGIALLASFVVPPLLPAPLGGKPSLRGARVFWAHGEKDERIAPAIARRGVKHLRGSHAEVTFVTDDVGHKVGAQGMKGLKIWLSTFADSAE